MQQEERRRYLIGALFAALTQTKKQQFRDKIPQSDRWKRRGMHGIMQSDGMR